MNVKGIEERIEAKRRKVEKSTKSKKIEMSMLRAHTNEKKEILKERLELKRLGVRSKKLKINLNKQKLDAKEIAIPARILRLAEVIAESAYDHEVPYMFILNSKNIVDDVIPLTHPNILKERSQEHIVLNLQDFEDMDFILCHTHPNGIAELSEEEWKLKCYVNLAVHVIHPLQEFDPDRREYQYIEKTTVTWCSKYFKHVLKIHSKTIKNVLII